MTIYALSSGPGISGVAIIRVSGQETSKVIKLLTKSGMRKIMIADCFTKIQGLTNTLEQSVLKTGMTWTGMTNMDSTRTVLP